MTTTPPTTPPPKIPGQKPSSNTIYQPKYKVKEEEIVIDIGTDSRFLIAARTWRSLSKDGDKEIQPPCQRVLCLHGWLDNANSFSQMAPLLCERHPLYIIAYDDAGCGQSQHKAHSAYTVVESVVDMYKILNTLGWTDGKTILMSHSRGAVCSLLFSSAFPDMIRKCIMLDAFGTYTTPETDGPKALRMGAMKYDKYTSTNGKVFSSMEEASTFMLENYRDSLTLESARVLCARQLVQVGPTAYQFRYDRRMIIPSLVQPSEKMTLGYFRAVVCPVLLVVPPTKDSVIRGATIEKVRTRFVALRKNNQQSRYVQLNDAKGHHFHINTPAVAVSSILDFIKEVDLVRPKL